MVFFFHAKKVRQPGHVVSLADADLPTVSVEETSPRIRFIPRLDSYYLWLQ